MADEEVKEKDIVNVRLVKDPEPEQEDFQRIIQIAIGSTINGSPLVYGLANNGWLYKLTEDRSAPMGNKWVPVSLNIGK